MDSKSIRVSTVSHLCEMDRKDTDRFRIVGDAFSLFVLFALWLWQFEGSENGSLYHAILAAIGFIAGVGIIVLLAVMLLAAFTSHQDSDSR
jgi:heme A synthase